MPGPYFLPPETVVYGDRNGYRMSAFHHLDLSLNLGRTGGRHGFGLGVYNAYNRKNPFFIYFDRRPGETSFRAKQVSLFPILPWMNYRFKF